LIAAEAGFADRLDRALRGRAGNLFPASHIQWLLEQPVSIADGHGPEASQNPSNLFQPVWELGRWWLWDSAASAI